MDRQAGDLSFDLEALDRLILYKAYYFHLAGTFWASQWVNFPGSGPGQAPIFCISRAQFFLYSFDESSGSRM
jgi:hypothetical protein